jgi:hypothetical protein
MSEVKQVNLHSVHGFIVRRKIIVHSQLCAPNDIRRCSNPANNSSADEANQTADGSETTKRFVTEHRTFASDVYRQKRRDACER